MKYGYRFCQQLDTWIIESLELQVISDLVRYAHKWWWELRDMDFKLNVELKIEFRHEDRV